MVGRRSAKQVKDRYYQNLSPFLIRTPFTDEEDRFLLQQQKNIGNKWGVIASFLKGRSENQVKNRWHSKSFQRLLFRASSAASMASDSSAAFTASDSSAAYAFASINEDNDNDDEEDEDKNERGKRMPFGGAMTIPLPSLPLLPPRPPSYSC